MCSTRFATRDAADADSAAGSLDEGVGMGRTCNYCGREELVDIHEVWGHDFMLETCCEWMHDEAVQSMASDGKHAGEYLGGKLKGLLPGDPSLRRVSDNGLGALILDFKLQLVQITFAEMKSFVGRHHRHCQPPKGWMFGIGVVNGSKDRSHGSLVGVTSVGRPVARMLDQRRLGQDGGQNRLLVLEANRQCIDPTLPSPLVKNAASMMYGWAARKAKAEGAEWIVSYVLDEEEGTALKAAGWTADHLTKGRSWSTRSRARPDTGPKGDKVRWCKQLVSAPSTSLNGNLAGRSGCRSRLGDALSRGREQNQIV